MTKLLSVLTAAAFACSFSLTAVAADDVKAQRKQVRDEYKAAKKECNKLKGDAEKACDKEAKEKRDAKIAALKTQKKGSAGSGTTAPAKTGTAAPAEGPKPTK